MGLFPLSRNFFARTHVKFTGVNEMEAMYERLRGLNVKVEQGSTFTFTSDLSYFASILLTRLKLRDRAQVKTLDL